MEILKKKKNNIFSKIIKFSLIIVFILVVFKPVFADPVPCKGPNNPPGCYDSKDSNIPDSKDSNGISISTGIKNPLSDEFKDIPTFIQGVLRFVLLIGIPLVALAIIYTGFLFVTAQGNSEKIKKAKQALIYTLIGAALLLGSLVITDAIKGSVDQIKSSN